jgi:aspartate aminotransferase
VKHVSTASLGPEVREMTITISGFSKSYCMTGWRLGWAIANREVIKKMSSLQSQSNSHVTSFVQWAGLTACELPQSVIRGMVAEFDKRRELCIARLDRLSEFCTYVRPTGGFYFFINFSKWLVPRKMSDVAFCKTLLSDLYVGVVPGSMFGKDNSIRLSYANSAPNLEKAFDRIEKFLRAR